MSLIIMVHLQQLPLFDSDLRILHTDVIEMKGLIKMERHN